LCVARWCSGSRRRALLLLLLLLQSTADTAIALMLVLLSLLASAGVDACAEPRQAVCPSVPACLQGSSSGGGSGANGEAGGADGAPACPPGLMRFGAHLALALWSLDIAEVAEG
jgi:hypothetical protein